MAAAGAGGGKEKKEEEVGEGEQKRSAFDGLLEEWTWGQVGGLVATTIVSCCCGLLTKMGNGCMAINLLCLTCVCV